MKTYSVHEWCTLAGLTPNEGKHLLNTGTIVPDIKVSTGTGDHNRLGFLDVFEGRIARELNRIPGSNPSVSIALILEIVRLETYLSVSPPPGTWGAFVNPQTRDPSAHFWLCKPAGDAAKVLNRQERDALLDDCRDALLLVRLDTLLLEIEEKTQDYASASDRGNAFAKKSVVVESPQAVIEEAIAREMAHAGLPQSQVEAVFGQLRDKLASLRPEHHTSATFQRFVEMVDAVVTITGPGPGYRRWRKDAASIMATWNKTKKQEVLRTRILQLVAARDAERATAAEGKTR